MTRYSNNLSDSLLSTPRGCLVGILLADAAVARQAAQALSAAGTWPLAFQSAKTWSVSSQLADAIPAQQCQPPEGEWREFRRASIATFALSASRASKGLAALGHLESGGIPAAAFKGLASMARLYPSPGKRSIKDADILIEKQHLAAALQSLSALGLTALEAHHPERLDRFLDNCPGFSGNKAIVLYAPDGFEVDLHWSVGIPGMEPAALLRRSDSVKLFNTPVRIVSPEDAIVLTARHAIRENLAVDTMCRDLFDIRLSCECLAARGTLETACRNAAQLQSHIPLLALTGILQSLDANATGVKEAAALLSGPARPKERRIAEGLRELFFYQVGKGPVSKDLLYLTHSRPARQILAGAWSNWQDYRGLMRSMEEKLDGEEVPLTRRLRSLFGAIQKTGPRHLLAIRALARMKYGG